MFEPPDHYHALSLRLSDVLNDIGVNERIVMKRRRLYLLKESMLNIHHRINGTGGPSFVFGSRIEGSTTEQLHSDVDHLQCSFKNKAIQDWSDWQLQPDKVQLLMVQDETTSPGYCLLQLLRRDVPLPAEIVQHKETTRDSRGRILMKNSLVYTDSKLGRTRHGPANAELGVPGIVDNDYVWALFCSSWPKEAEPWLQQQNINGWPTQDLKRYSAEHGCFVVPVASRESPHHDTEWRISTSYAERCLMLNINMTQLRCYILMKMILKTFFIPVCEDSISSFMCKNVLFHCIADSSAREWTESNLIARLNQCLHALRNNILTENCPHFIIPRNNLLAGKLSIPVKDRLLEIICNLTGNIEQSLLVISIDQLGNRLRVKSGGRILADLPSREINAGKVIVLLSADLATAQKENQCLILQKIYHRPSLSVYQSLIQNISAMCQIYSVGSKMERVACRYYTPLLCATLGSIAASVGINHSQTIPPIALMWFSAGLKSDLLSSRLKLASALFCAGQYKQCETIIIYLTNLLELITVFSNCRCYDKYTLYHTEFARICYEKNEEDVIIKQNSAFCVTFLPCEIYCVPKELRYEFFRSTEEDRALRGERDFWMDWAAVDSITYLHFMEYKVNTQLHRPTEKLKALDNLIRTINTELRLTHMETALNLLGQCMEQENRLNAALCCYMMSLNERRRNNVAKWHVCRLFARQFRCRQ